MQALTCYLFVILQVEDILECYVKSGRCELFQNVTSLDIVQHLRDKPNYYVGVASSTYDLLQITSITKNVMIYFQGDIEEKNQSDCHADSGTKVKVVSCWLQYPQVIFYGIFYFIVSI